MSVFDFTLQKELVQSANARQLRSLDDLIGRHGRIHIETNSLLEAVMGNPDQAARSWWKSKLNTPGFKKKKDLKKMLEGIQELEEAVGFCKVNNIDLAILEDDIAEILIDEDEISHEDKDIEICHREYVRQTKVFKKIKRERNDDIKIGENQEDVWYKKFEPALRDTKKIDIFDPHILQRYFESSPKIGQGAKKLISKCVEIKGVKEINIFCYSINLTKCDSLKHIQDVRNSLEELINPIKKGLIFKFYMNAPKLFPAKSSSIQFENEVIICDHLSEIFDDKDPASGLILEEKKFAIKERTENFLSSKKSLRESNLYNIGSLVNYNNQISGCVKFE